MGFFKDFKEDLSETANRLNKDNGVKPVAEEEKNDTAKSVIENPSLAQLSAKAEQETGGKDKNKDEDEGNKMAAKSEYGVTVKPAHEEPGEDAIADETAVITAGLCVTGDLDASGSVDVLGAIFGNVKCRGRLMISGSISGNSKANEVFADSAQIDGNVSAKGAVKVGQGTVIVGNITASSAVIAGAVKGDIDIQGPVVIDSTAIIVGDIKSKTVQINNGATIDGRCTQCYSEVNTTTIFDIKPKNKKIK